jgi:hypothetical protein
MLRAQAAALWRLVISTSFSTGLMDAKTALFEMVRSMLSRVFTALIAIDSSLGNFILSLAIFLFSFQEPDAHAPALGANLTA